MVDFCREGDGWWFERVFGWEGEFDEEFSFLVEVRRCWLGFVLGSPGGGDLD
jgi:hypothetical protein